MLTFLIIVILKTKLSLKEEILHGDHSTSQSVHMITLTPTENKENQGKYVVKNFFFNGKTKTTKSEKKKLNTEENKKI